MFSKSEKKGSGEMARSNGSSASAGTVNIICAGTLVEGVIKSNADLRVDGTVKGNLYSKNKIVIGAAGLVQGDVNCKHVDVHGRIEGNIYSEDLVTLKAKSTVTGDVTAKQLSVEIGAKFVGVSNMGENFKVDDSKMQTKTNPKTISPERK